MSEAHHTPSRGEEMLARLAELDLAAAEQAHARMMAAPDETFDAAARTYQRMARSLRQTLALKARLERGEIPGAARRQAPQLAQPSPAADLAALEQAEVDARVDDLQDAVGRMVYVLHGQGRYAADVLDRFDRELDDWIEEDDFLALDLDCLVLRAARLLSIRDDIARGWRALPRPPAQPDPQGQLHDDPRPDGPAPPPVPYRNSG